MTEALAEELNRCAGDAHWLMNSRVASDGKTRLLSSAARVLADASGATIEETRTAAVPFGNSDDPLWNLTLVIDCVAREERRGSSDRRGRRGVAVGFINHVG